MTTGSPKKSCSELIPAIDRDKLQKLNTEKIELNHNAIFQLIANLEEDDNTSIQ